MYDNDHLDEQWLRQTPPPRRRGAGCGLTLLLVLLLVLAGAVFYPRIRARLTPVPAVQIRVESSVLPDTAPNCTANPRTAAVLRSAMRDQTDAAVYDCDAATLEACMAELLDDPELWVRSYQYTVHGGLNAHITVTFDWVYPDDGPARRAGVSLRDAGGLRRHAVPALRTRPALGCLPRARQLRVLVRLPVRGRPADHPPYPRAMSLPPAGGKRCEAF